jgi:hypothetical protein
MGTIWVASLCITSAGTVTFLVFSEIDLRRCRGNPSLPSLDGCLSRLATGQHDTEWANWYAEYIVRERTGQRLPS